MKVFRLRSAVLLAAGLLATGLLPGISTAQDSSPDQAAPSQQQAPAPGERMHGQKVLEGLNLTEDQQAQIDKIRSDAKAKADAVNADSSLSGADKQAKIRAIHRDSMKQIRAVLTPEQRQQLRAKRRAARGARQPS